MHLPENSIQNLLRDPSPLRTEGKTPAQLATLVTARTRAIRSTLAALTIPNLRAHAKANDITLRKGAPKDEILDLLATTHASHEGYAAALRALTAQIATAETEAHTENDLRNAEEALAAEYDRQDAEYRDELDAQLNTEAATAAPAAAEIDAHAENDLRNQVEAYGADREWEEEDTRAEINKRLADEAKTVATFETAGVAGFTDCGGYNTGYLNRVIGDYTATWGPVDRRGQYLLITRVYAGTGITSSDQTVYDTDQRPELLAALLAWQAWAMEQTIATYQEKMASDEGPYIAPGARVLVNSSGEEGIIVNTEDPLGYEGADWATVALDNGKIENSSPADLEVL